MQRNVNFGKNTAGRIVCPYKAVRRIYGKTGTIFGLGYAKPGTKNLPNEINMKKTAKSQKVMAIPEGFHTVTPYLIVENADELIEFIKEGLNGEVTFMHRSDDDKVSHATVKVGDSLIMISDTMSDMEPELAMLYLYVDDVDSVYQTAIDANAESIQAPKDEFYGDRASAVKDRWGNKWWIATHKENVDHEELNKRAKEARRQKEAQPTH